ncbi:RHS repeat-associated core domain-containing protein [Nocardioides sp. NPDC059952]|uniref:golvesin C-terminal-like domain-containing protein n=1 Tax=Nocardioides sp. NPDC059952 TaxID=3347014 RepID=UPI0036578FF5
MFTETTYDAAGRAVKTSLPPSDGQTVRNESTVDYYANGWIKASTDAWGIKTRYEYDDLGAQTARTLTSADGSASRTMTWAYYPDGKLKAKSDDGVPVGSHSVVTDDDTNGLFAATGTWTKTSATGEQGTSHRTHAAATGSTDKFTWTLDVPADGAYTLAAAWPQVSGAATDAKFTLNHGDAVGTDVNFTANQTTGAAAWNTLGRVTLTKGEKVTVALAPTGTGVVVADSVRLVRDNAADTDAEDKAFAYGYDLNGNLTDISDTSRGTAKDADAYVMAYDGLNQIKSVREDLAGSPAATTSYTYNNLGKPLTVAHPDQASDYVYNDPRNLLTKVTVDDLNDTKAAKVTNYAYDVLGREKTITKGNGNVTTNAFQADGALKSMREETSAGALVASHAYTYDANGNQLEDVASKRNADDSSATLDSTTTYVYDPVDRLKEKTKAGHNASTETYVHDANANVIQQSVGGTSTSFNYDRNRLLSSTVDGQTASYRYDPFGRQTSVVGGGKTISRTTYDGFDHIKVAEQTNAAGVLEATTYTYDPLDRTASKTTSGADGKKTDYTYLGLSQEVLGEEVAGELTKSYQYSPWGQRLSQVSHQADAEAGVEAEETGYYGYNAHTDVETITDDAGKTVATYGYTAYGENDEAEFTGIDKPEAGNPEGPADESFNAYRFNGKRWDAGSGTYDMGFRDYNPGLNTFTTRDMYNGALADMGLGMDPFTGNRYAYTAGNPISGIEIDGHNYDVGGIGPSYTPQCIKNCEGYQAKQDAAEDRMAAEDEANDAADAEAAKEVALAACSWVPLLGVGCDTYDATRTYEEDGLLSWQMAAAGAGFIPGGDIFKTPKALERIGDAANGGAKAIIDPSKYDYLFGRVTSNRHNAARSAQNAQLLSRVGVRDNAAGRKLLGQHFDDVAANSDNVLDTYNDQYGSYQIKESLFSGPGGMIKFESTWQETDAGLRLTTVIPLGGVSRYR